MNIRDYAKHSITWKAKINNGYGDTYGDDTPINNVYVEKQNDTVLIIAFDFFACKKYDSITLTDDCSYKITDVKEYFKARTTIFDHLEIMGERIYYPL